MNNISKPSETDSSLKSNAMNQISLDALFSNLNKSLKNKFNSQNLSSQNSPNSSNKYIDFFKFNQNFQSSNIKVLQSSPAPINNSQKIKSNAGNQKDIQLFNDNKCECIKPSNLSQPLGSKDFFFNNIHQNISKENDNCLSTSQPQNSEPKSIELVQRSSASITLTYPESPISQNISSDAKNKLNISQSTELAEKSDADKFSQVKPLSINQMPQFARFPSLFLRPHLSNSSDNFNNNNNSYKKLKLSPLKLNFLPSEEWKTSQSEITLENLISTYFRVNCSSKIHFEHKLWNSLQITLYSPQLFPFVGVKWLSKTIIQVNQNVFGNFLDLKKPIAALFTSKGAFPSHGFREIPDNQIRGLNDKISPSEFSECRFFEHRNKIFRRDSSEEEIASIKCELPS